MLGHGQASWMMIFVAWERVLRWGAFVTFAWRLGLSKEKKKKKRAAVDSTASHDECIRIGHEVRLHLAL